MFLVSIHNWRLDEREAKNCCLGIDFIVLYNVFTSLQATGSCGTGDRKGCLNRAGLWTTITTSTQQPHVYIFSIHIKFGLKMVPATRRKILRENGHNYQPKPTDSSLWESCLESTAFMLTLLCWVSLTVWRCLNLSPKKTLWEENLHPFNSREKDPVNQFVHIFIWGNPLFTFMKDL